MTEKHAKKSLVSGKGSDRHPIINQSQVFTRYVGKLEVGPWQQSRMSLGVFDDNNPAKGFSVNLTAGPEFAEAVMTRVISLNRSKQYELMLHIANNGDKKIGIEIWQM